MIMKAGTDKVLFFHTGASSFVNKDARILEELGNVRQFAFTARSKAATPLLFIRQLFFLVRNLSRTRILLCQFAGYHSLLPVLAGRMTGKPVLIIAGGTDCHAFPGIGYGNFNKKLLGLFTSWSFRLCTHISPKHESLWWSEYGYDSREPGVQGIKAFIPGITTPHTSVPNGYDADVWKADTTVQRRKNSFITVSAGMHYSFQKNLKGIDLILEVASKLPDCSFTVIGATDQNNLRDVPENVRLIPPCDQKSLIREFSAHAYYFQLSMAEGFPNALCEAMLCGCIPIGSSVFSIPEIIGKDGFILDRRDPGALTELLKRVTGSAISSDVYHPRKAIVERFPLARRKTEILSICRSLIGGTSKP
jgi:glycosyltransferase involved in cell wall biosynthesis